MVNQSLKAVAIIPARGGSKGIHKKNIRFLGQHPLIAYSIASAKASKIVQRIIVSTDDPRIAKVALRYGAEVPFLRPRELARDETLDYPVFDHALKWLKRHEKQSPEFIVHLRPTSPFRPKGLIDKAIGLLAAKKEADCVRGVTISGQNPYKMWKLDSSGKLSPLLVSKLKEACNAPRQKLPVTYWQTGHIDVLRSRTLEKYKSMIGEKIYPVLIEPQYCADIDSEQDLALGALKLSLKSLDIDFPKKASSANSRQWPESLALIVFDFDGVFTDNRVWTNQDGGESVVCNRSDGMGIKLIKNQGIRCRVLSAEANRCVAVRCQKLKIDYEQNIKNKVLALKNYVKRHHVSLQDVMYVGNDVNDIECMKIVGYSVAVADSHPDVLKVADLVLVNMGGKGAVRELCDKVLECIGDSKHVKKN